MDIKVEGQDIHCTFSRKFLFELWFVAKGNNAEKCRYVFQQLTTSLPNEDSIEVKNLEIRCRYLCKKMHEYFKKASQSKSIFTSRHSNWLRVREDVVLSQRESVHSNVIVDEHENIPATSTSTATKRHSASAGRPKKPFSECSQRSKRRRLLELSKLDESFISGLKHDDPVNDKNEIDTDEVLSLIVGAKLTKHQYTLIKNFINSKSSASSIPVSLPSYQKVLKAKKKCYPQQDSIVVTESSAEIELQNLLDHTASRVIESQRNVVDSVEVKSIHKLILMGKWGFDGTTGQSEYKQSFTDQNAEDGSLFITSYVPIRLVMREVENCNSETVIWDNPRPASTRYCRPIRFQFKKETKELSQQEEMYIQEKINCLQPSTVLLSGKSLVIEHILQLTMIDGKVCAALCNIAPSRCFICGASPKEMNNIDKCLKKPVFEERYEYGLSPLHSWIRFFEYFIHISYRLDVKKWQMRSQEEKRLFTERKKVIQRQFREKLGLVIDKPQSGGSGSSNDGNTARKFFENSTISAEITGLRRDLIYRCSIILKVLSSGYRIDKGKFEEYTIQTAKLLVAEYAWYYLPSSVHKVLVHGAEVEEYGLLSVGQLSEEPAEAKNKDVKYFREHNTRKKSRPTCNIDLLNRLLLTSDPYITGLRSLPKKKEGSLPSDCLTLISADQI